VTAPAGAEVELAVLELNSGCGGVALGAVVAVAPPFGGDDAGDVVPDPLGAAAFCVHPATTSTNAPITTPRTVRGVDLERAFRDFGEPR
jgi:hypothetical protein